MLRSSSSLCMSFKLALSESEEEYNVEGKSYVARSLDPRRWYVLSLYCSLAFTQIIIWNTWSPIANSALFAFETWQESTIALLNNWGCLMFILLIGPCCWLLNKRGIRTSFVLASFMCTIGAGIRLLPSNERVFTILVHSGAVLNAIGGVAISPSILLISSTWFPANQRTCATGAGTYLSMLGIAGSYVLGPMIVSEPPTSGTAEDQERMRIKIRTQISYLLFLDFLVEVILFILVVLTFPPKPRCPPSRSSILRLTEETRISFFDSVGIIFKNKDFWLLSLAGGLCSGITGPWLSLLTIIFAHTGITQLETARIGFWTIICSSCLGLSVCKVTDAFPGHIKAILLLLIASADFMFLWMLLLNTHVVQFRKNTLVLVVIGGLSLVWSTPALFYELGAELTFPVQEGIVAGIMMALNNFAACIVYMQMYIFPTLSVSWMNYALFIFGLASLICLLCVGEKYNRLEIDRN